MTELTQKKEKTVREAIQQTLSIGEWVGSDKQIVWAKNIAFQQIETIANLELDMDDKRKLMRYLASIRTAKWWIDNRDSGSIGLMSYAFYHSQFDSQQKKDMRSQTTLLNAFSWQRNYRVFDGKANDPARKLTYQAYLNYQVKILIASQDFLRDNFLSLLLDKNFGIQDVLLTPDNRHLSATEEWMTKDIVDYLPGGWGRKCPAVVSLKYCDNRGGQLVLGDELVKIGQLEIDVVGGKMPKRVVFANS